MRSSAGGIIAVKGNGRQGGGGLVTSVPERVVGLGRDCAQFPDQCVPIFVTGIPMSEIMTSWTSIGLKLFPGLLLTEATATTYRCGLRGENYFSTGREYRSSSSICKHTDPHFLVQARV
jgi:hypothetical protein